MRRLFGVIAATSTVNGWTPAFSFPGDRHIANAWSATVNQNGSSVTATDAGYNGTIPPGGTASFGCQGTGTANDTSATFRLNGASCAGG
jgi:cellulase/cellobiase CelA1